jgi:hypothetical protein
MCEVMQGLDDTLHKAGGGVAVLLDADGKVWAHMRPRVAEQETQGARFHGSVEC